MCCWWLIASVGGTGDSVLLVDDVMRGSVVGVLEMGRVVVMSWMESAVGVVEPEVDMATAAAAAAAAFKAALCKAPGDVWAARPIWEGVAPEATAAAADHEGESWTSSELAAEQLAARAADTLLNENGFE